MSKQVTTLAFGLLVVFLLVGIIPDTSGQDGMVRVMILDGESAGPYHDWPLVTSVLDAQLTETGLFDVDVVTAPGTEGELSGFMPRFEDYDAVVFNYDAPDERWPAALKQSFEDYVEGGGGVVIVHASDNAFPNWTAFNEMKGFGGWRGQTGPYWYYREGELVSDSRPGPAGSHGQRIPFVIDRREPHPITDGLPDSWMNQGDELYAELRGPGGMTVLATAYSDPENNGTGFDEPILMVSEYGAGRVFHTTLGHDVQALSSVDFVVTFQRGTEWAATGGVTLPVPDAFPDARTVSYRPDLAAMSGMPGR